MADFTKTIKASGGDYSSWADFQTWFYATGNVAGNTVNCEVQGGFDLGSSWEPGAAVLDADLNVYTKTDEIATLGMASFGVFYGAALTEGSGRLTLRALKGSNGGYTISIREPNCPLTIESCFLMCEDSPGTSNALVHQPGSSGIIISQSVLAFTAPTNGSAFAIASNISTIGFTIDSCSILVYTSAGSPAFNVQSYVGPETVDITNSYIYNYGAGGAVAASTGVSASGNTVADPVHEEQIIPANNSTPSAVLATDYGLSTLSPLYPFSTYGVGVDGEYWPTPVPGTVTPVIASLSPTFGVKKGGYIGVLTGTDFKVGQGSVTVNSVPATITSWADLSVAFRFPQGAGAVTVQLTNTDSLSDTIAFTYQQPGTPGSQSRRPRTINGMPADIAERLLLIAAKIANRAKRRREL